MPPRLALGYSESAGETIQRLLPEAKVAKAFNIVGNPHFVHPHFPNGGPATMFICGDDQESKKQVVDKFLHSLGGKQLI
jgi:8-hydroxy-5-deazaflavin:NADPH oxidoreductase